MNLNQAAHGDREHGFIAARLRMPRKVIAGYWQDEKVLRQLGRLDARRGWGVGVLQAAQGDALWPTTCAR